MIVSIVVTKIVTPPTHPHPHTHTPVVGWGAVYFLTPLTLDLVMMLVWLVECWRRVMSILRCAVSLAFKLLPFSLRTGLKAPGPRRLRKYLEQTCTQKPQPGGTSAQLTHRLINRNKGVSL